ncbi:MULTISPECIES: ERF family protein [unclassified Enterobacter cloacae complex]|uniref:ERF family protein n=1 Tax=unclassified Enterobacter cloacae complex TaxID=2757714 RepID=UPI001875C467|nr:MULTISPECIES: ERF family protein [unclassified Enterobacter cloacae complex]MBE4946301.1 ERF family protein [Enterobacter cloacae complex sp. P1B]MBE4971468.1 ERF family protein [Enterobacter cloacae complex sp. P11RS]
MEHKKVYAAISAVAKEMASTGISKDRVNKVQGFNFRGIDQVYNALAPALVTHGLVILPRLTERTCTERINKNGTALFYVVVKAEFDFVSTEDGSIHTVTTYGEAMDSGDKATNKAMSIAYKYAAFQAFCIPTEETAIDADAEVHQVAPQDAEAALKEFGDKATLAQSVEELQAAYKEVWPKLGGVKSYEERAAETYKTRGRELHKQAA